MTDRRLDDRLLSAAEREADGLAPREDLAELLMEARAELRRLRALFTERDAFRIEWVLEEYPEIASWVDGEYAELYVDHALHDLVRRIREARGEPSA
jgi:hypothetical protein